MQHPIIATFYDHILDIAKQENCSVPEALDEARKLGVAAVEISYANVQGRADEAAFQLSSAGMGVTAMPVHFRFETDPDVDGQWPGLLEAARTIGAKILLVIPGFVPEGGDREECTQRLVRCTQRLGELADKAGLSLVMEDFDNAAAPYSTCGEMLRFIDAVPGLAACFDTGNFCFAAEDALEAYGKLRGRISHVHCKDRAGAPEFGNALLRAVDGAELYPSPVGAGIIPMEELLARLKADGYRGAYTIEHYGAEPMLECLKRSVEWLKPRL